MKFLERLLSKFDINARLRDENALLLEKWTETRARLVAVTSERDALQATVLSLQEAADLEIAQYKQRVEASMRQYNGACNREVQANQDRDRARQERDELAAHVEELTHLNAILEQRLREAKVADDEIEQLKIYEPAPPAEEGAEEPADKVELETTAEFVYQLRGVFFEDEGRHHWLFARGEESIKARIVDKRFLEQLARRKVFFAAGDAARVKLHTVTFRRPDESIYARHSVVEVLAIIPPRGKQLSLVPEPAEEVAHASAD